MATEIIKTKDKNIVKEVTTITKELDLKFLIEERDGLVLRIAENKVLVDKLLSLIDSLPEEVKPMVSEKISYLTSTVSLDEVRLEELKWL